MKNNMKFYTCLQNNSGGYFIKNADVDVFVCVEAKSLNFAKQKFKSIFKDYNEYCPCCGIRWKYNNLTKLDGFDLPCIFGNYYKDYINTFYCPFSSIIIYYANGIKRKYDLRLNLKKLNFIDEVINYEEIV